MVCVGTCVCVCILIWGGLRNIDTVAEDLALVSGERVKLRWKEGKCEKEMYP